MRWRHVVSLLVVVASLVPLLWASRAGTVPIYSGRAGLPCGACHFDPNGGGPRNEFGFNYARNRHSTEPETGKAWSDVELANRVGDTVPIYFGLDHRVMLIANDTDPIDGIDRVGFYNMENALHLTFQPHRMLTLVYTRDGLDQSSKSQDAFGMVGGGRWGSYFKAGRFRTPFGLRMDDHTVATRNGFLDFDPSGPGGRFLPWDPRSPDTGVEVGAEGAGFFGRGSFTNGESHPLFGASTHAQAATAKLGYANPTHQTAVSYYHDFRDPGVTERWGAYGLARVGRLVAMAEVGGGTDRLAGVENEVSALFAELDYSFWRGTNLRVRYDRLDLGIVGLATEDAIFNRYAVEGEWVPVPFAELRATVRRIEREDVDGEETQGYLQFHFSY